MKPICVPCQRFFRPAKNDFPFVEAMPTDGNPEPGRVESEKWQPYKLWFGDLWKCPDCDAKIVVGVARLPLAEHYQPDFAEKVSHYQPTLNVNDC